MAYKVENKVKYTEIIRKNPPTRKVEAYPSFMGG
jgi:hypothetical protein